jgi:hypothetical protein
MIPKKCGCLEWKNFIQLNPSILFKKIMVGRKEKEGQVLMATKDLGSTLGSGVFKMINNFSPNSPLTNLNFS